ncbi:MAG: hypothetical protein ACOYN0_08245 [Phycisphaerales bacterium]
MTGPSVSSLVAPVFLRLVLGATLLWSGIGLLSAKMSVQGERAAILANLGAVPQTTPVLPDTTPAPIPPPAATPSVPTPSKPPAPQTPEKPKDTGLELPPLMQTAPAPAPQEQPAAPTKTYTAADFPAPLEVARLHRVVLQIHDAASPAARADGTTPSPLWPGAMARGRWPVVLAWGVSIATLVAGAFLFVGLFTRLSALIAALAVGVTLWLGMIVPAMISGTAQFGFVPAGGPWDLNAAGESVHAGFSWMLLQAASALALLFAGPGYLSLDRILFPGGGRESEPRAKAAPARPLPGD